MSTLTIGGAPRLAQFRGNYLRSQNPAVRVGSARDFELGDRAKIFLRSDVRARAQYPGVRNVFAATADFTGIAFLDRVRRFAPIISRLRMETSPRTNTEWDLDYDLQAGRINTSMALVNYHYGPFTMGGGDTFLRVLDSLTGGDPRAKAISTSSGCWRATDN